MYTEENFYFDYSDKIIQETIQKITEGEGELTSEEYAIKAYNYVRDSWEYYPYHFSLNEKDWKASNLMQRKTGHCLEKATILITLLRAKNIPSRLGLAKVKNHLAVDKIVETLQSDELVPHGYVEVYLHDKWVKATPAFNKSLCNLLGVNVLEFNGKEDSIFHEYDKSEEKMFMEYLDDYGAFDEVPLLYMFELMKQHYPIISEKRIEKGEVLDLSNL
ncbi:transglutaminase [Tenacibaculum holothuriorum]|uniref:Transglutaminase n=1 Tax=Tenacibaculum holothuriorum TaxID=1635173 RepID=A0A1Y2PHQ0_9FLAO|nr:transglutaminase-like domain-containing protein [Tenacibaculum holothuriorum]OSY89531.1 transglutaminase [Tenacibaculum holothuriorum]